MSRLASLRLMDPKSPKVTKNAYFSLLRRTKQLFLVKACDITTTTGRGIVIWWDRAWQDNVRTDRQEFEIAVDCGLQLLLGINLIKKMLTLHKKVLYLLSEIYSIYFFEELLVAFWNINQINVMIWSKVDFGDIEFQFCLPINQMFFYHLQYIVT